MTVEPGQTLQHYRIVEKIDEGGMVVVWRAIDTRHDREVAVKVLPDRLIDSEHALARFEREARAMAALSHSNILELYDVGRASGVSYAVTELLEGRTPPPLTNDTDDEFAELLRHCLSKGQDPLPASVTARQFRPGVAVAWLIAASMIPLIIYFFYLWYR